MVYIDPDTQIGPGFYIGHACRIGGNSGISAHVTLGRKSRESNMGCSTLGDRVFVGPGAVIIGAIALGNDSAISANAVVTKTRAVVVGNPGRVISDRGSDGCVTWQWPPGANASSSAEGT